MRDAQVVVDVPQDVADVADAVVAELDQVLHSDRFLERKFMLNHIDHYMKKNLDAVQQLQVL
ncbi:hypothetical protein GLW07_13765 [Bacillus hwajinpoensis]|uniref:Uncharacterized protein n=1 Tax=Guptibacillus hwajinpoensis TaxID=208199 RepID=A0A845F0W0_9BACL|nr:hypothetical protein [Pseudalkalibacillus hwajinpoensis]